MVVKSAAQPAGRPLRYDQVRSDIRTGDVLLFQGRSALSRLIRWGSESPYSHAGMTAWWNERLVVLQSAGRGVEVLPVSAAVDEYDGQVDWYTLDPEHDPKLDRGALLQCAIDELGTPYATVGLLELMWRMLLNRFRHTKDPKVDPEAMFCSQYVSFCYRTAGLDLRDDTEDACTSPGDLSTCGKLVRRGVLHRPPDVAPGPAASADRASGVRAG